MPREESPSLAFPVILVFLCYALGAWSYWVPFTGDEKVYLTTAMEMWQRQDWIHPWLMGRHSYFKPPFLYWATLCGWSVFGFGQLGAFLPSAIATAGTAFFVSRISESRLAAIWFAACAGTLTYGASVQMEIWVVFFYSAAWWAVLRKSPSGNSSKSLFLGFAFAGLLSLVKSPLYSVLWVLGYWLYLVAGREFGRFRSPGFWMAHLLGIAVGISWFGLILHRDGARFWHQYVQEETLNKLGGNGSTALHMWGDFSTFCLPYLLLLGVIIGRACMGLGRLALGWALLPAIFFSIFPYRTETYLYPLIPFAALAMARLPGLERTASPRFRSLIRAAAQVNGWVGALALLAIAVIAVSAGMAPAWMGFLLGCAGIWSAVMAATGRWGGLAYSYLGVIFLIRIASIQLGGQDIAGLREAVAANPGRNIVFYDETRYIWHEVGLLGVALGRFPVRATEFPTLLTQLRQGALLVLGDGQWEAVTQELRRSLSPAEQARLQSTDWWRWKRSFNLPTVPALFSLGNREAPEWRQTHQRLYKIISLIQGSPSKADILSK